MKLGLVLVGIGFFVGLLVGWLLQILLHGGTL
jgi:hypothetical protein